jgi:uncharacterized protein (AIM24 family)
MTPMRSDIFDQANLEVENGQRFFLQNSKMLKVTLGEPVLAAKGSMVAYQGAVQFHHKGSDTLAKFVKRAISSDDQALMTVSGQGDVFFARFAETVFIIHLEGDAISVGGSSLLAFDATLQWDLHRTRGAGMMTGGLFNTLIQGHGSVALTSDGQPVILDCSQQPTFVDPNAAVCWSANLVPEVVSSMNMSSLLRGGTGEAFQYKFHGPGFVVVQPSEGFAGLGQTS